MKRAESLGSLTSSHNTVEIGANPIRRTSSSGSLLSTTSGGSNAAKVGGRLSRAFSSLSHTVAGTVGGKRAEGIAKAFAARVEGPGLGAQKCATDNSDVCSEETGQWQYLVIDPSGIRPREDPIYNKESKRNSTSSGGRFKEGSIVTVDRRRTAGWTTWLALTNGDGWLFDVSPKDKKVRLVEVEVATGMWQYQCVVDRVPIMLIPQMKLPSAKATQKAQFLTNGEMAQIQERVRPLNGKGSFLRLADGRGWALDFVDGQQVLQRQTPSGPCAFGTTNGNGHSNSTGSNGYGRSTSGYSSSSEICIIKPFMSGQETSVVDCHDPLPGVGDSLGQPMHGEWFYIVVDPQGITMRSSPTYDKAFKMTKKIDEGEVVVVQERIPGDGTVYLRVASPAGWGFEQTPSTISGKQQKLRMMQIQVDRGHWYYRVVADRGVALRSRCSFAESSKTAKGPLKGALCEITERVRVGESTFLKLKDGSGWVFDVKNGRPITEGPIQVQVLPPYTMATVHAKGTSQGIHLSSSPTKEKSAQTKFLLVDGSRVKAVMTCEVEHTKWMFASRGEGGSGIEGWAPIYAFSVDQGQANGNHSSSTQAPTPWQQPPAYLGSDGYNAVGRCTAKVQESKGQMVHGDPPSVHEQTPISSYEAVSSFAQPEVSKEMSNGSLKGWCEPSPKDSQRLQLQRPF